MLTELVTVMAPVLIAVLVGYGWGRSSIPFEADFVTRVVMHIGAPCLVVAAIGGAEISGEGFAQVVYAAVLVLSLTALMAVIWLRLRGGDMRVLLPPVVFPNNGNMGLPLCLFAFGEQGLALALGFFIVQMAALMVFGVMLVSGGEAAETGAQKDQLFHATIQGVKRLLVQPLTYAIVIAVALLVFNIQLPRWLFNSLDLLGDVTIPLMLLTLGVSLSRLQTGGWWLSVQFSLLRIGGGFLCGLLALWVFGLTGTAAHVVLLQSIMPAAVFNYLLAEQYQRDPPVVAGIVVTSTLISLLAVPLLLVVLL